jgi:hypothetical protein
MASIIFYSWQSDLPNSTNRGFIQFALEQAAKEIRGDDSIAVEPVIDRDTAGIPGSPDIAATILEKINQCDIFACDVSIINQGSETRLAPNPNVLIELGYALKRLGWGRIIMIQNTEFGNVEDLPFDLKMKRIITYASSERDDNRSDERKKLKSKLVLALKEIFRQTAKPDESSLATISIPTQEDLAWRNKMRQMAMEDYSKSGFTAYVEAFSVLSLPRGNVFQNELVEAVKTSKISTFGWPIGVMGFGSDEMRPKPLSDGIINSIFGLNGDSYDFWALKKDGSFYLLKSLFEDKRGEKQVFFNTRIVRTTEMLMFLSSLYKKLGALKENVISFHLRYAGLANRYLTSIGNRSLSRSYGPCKENDIETNIAIILADLDKSVSSLVSELLSPVFMLFDFFELEQKIFDDIVVKFRGGKVT